MTQDQHRPDDRLRLARLARGFSQDDLARGAGITRQAISGIESGRWSPSLDVALALARVLDSSVESLFGVPGEAPLVSARMVAKPKIAGTVSARVLVGEIGGETVAYPLAGDASLVPGFAPALGVAQAAVVAGSERSGDRPVNLLRIADAAPTVVVAGCDPALALLRGPLGRHRPPLELAWWPCGNAVAAELMLDRAAHAAALHRSNDTVVEPRAGTVVVGFASWREGLAVAPRVAQQVGDLADVVHQGLRIANREPGSEARRLLEGELARLGIAPSELLGYEAQATAHLLVASAIAGGFADVGVTTEPAALTYGLGFIPWQEEICEIHIREDLMGSVEVRGLLDVLGGHELARQLSTIPGYDASSCGRLSVDS